MKKIKYNVLIIGLLLSLFALSGCNTPQYKELTAGTIEVTCNNTTIIPEGHNTKTFLNGLIVDFDTPSVGDLASSLETITCKKADLSKLHLRLKGTNDDKVLFSVYDTGYRLQSFETESFTVPKESGRYYICVRVKWIGDKEISTNPSDYIYTNYFYQLEIQKDSE